MFSIKWKESYNDNKIFGKEHTIRKIIFASYRIWGTNEGKKVSIWENGIDKNGKTQKNNKTLVVCWMATEGKSI